MGWAKIVWLIMFSCGVWFNDRCVRVAVKLLRCERLTGKLFLVSFFVLILNFWLTSSPFHFQMFASPAVKLAHLLTKDSRGLFCFPALITDDYRTVKKMKIMGTLDRMSSILTFNDFDLQTAVISRATFFLVRPLPWIERSRLIKLVDFPLT